MEQIRQAIGRKLTWLPWRQREEVLRLAEQLQESTTEKLLLQDRVDHAERETERWYELAKTARDNETKALHMLANFRLQPFGVTPFPEETKLPTTYEPTSLDPVPRRMTPSEAVARATQRFKRQVVEKLNVG